MEGGSGAARRGPAMEAWLVVAVVVGLLAGCAGGPAAAPAAPGTPPPVPPSTAQPASPPPDPVAVCAGQLTYWAGEQLRHAPDAGLDYQEMGLTGAQADALGVLVGEARARGGDRPAGWLSSRARALCTALAAPSQPTGGGWP